MIMYQLFPLSCGANVDVFGVVIVVKREMPDLQLKRDENQPVHEASQGLTAVRREEA